ncbi:helix-hairpin-helix domain-containing protein [Acidipropionibacterium virtanenii]|uniref:helix-hairpin-helix domain-containing protein n=1 Tax=Acidipropionibacterium virtanenii TaxID=2057246 RepID=UPI000DEC8C8B|nr:helix-hairpin-helix domain-containing protein [Acidipropionibacterium virtanenii]
MKNTHDSYRDRLEDLLAGLPARDVGPRHGTGRDGPDTQPEPDVGAAEDGAGPAPRARPPLVLGRTHLSALGIVLVLVLTVVAVMLMRSRATVVPLVASVSPAAAPVSSPSSSSSLSPASPAATIRVHVTGKVARPDVYALTAGARVVDALRAAGGLTRGAHPGDLNLAAPVCDGCQVQIPASGNGRIVGPDAQAAGTSPAAASSSTTMPGSSANPADQRIDLNSATSDQLQTLDGVGPATAAKILAWRTTHGRFTDVSELQEIDGIGPKTYARIKDHVRV